jgi:hypothetical protein
MPAGPQATLAVGVPCHEAVAANAPATTVTGGLGRDGGADGAGPLVGGAVGP